MRLLSLSIFALALSAINVVNSEPQAEVAEAAELAEEVIAEEAQEEVIPVPNFNDPDRDRECRLRPCNLLRSRREIIGVSNIPSFNGIGNELLFAFKDGAAIKFNPQDLHHRRRHFEKFLLAPAYGDREDCNTDSLESFEFDCMSVTMCPGVISGLMQVPVKALPGATVHGSISPAGHLIAAGSVTLSGTLATPPLGPAFGVATGPFSGTSDVMLTATIPVGGADMTITAPFTGTLQIGTGPIQNIVLGPGAPPKMIALPAGTVTLVQITTVDVDIINPGKVTITGTAVSVPVDVTIRGSGTIVFSTAVSPVVTSKLLTITGEVGVKTQPFGRHRNGKTFFAYHKKGDSFPSAAYASRGPASREFCQVFPTTPHPETLCHCPGFAQPSSTAFGMFDDRYGDLYFMVDYDNNDLLVQVGTTLLDCDNPLVRRHFEEKIVSFATCCYLPIVFIGFENGNVGIFAFKTVGHECGGRLVCISTLPPPCGCDCVPPVPIGISVCCDFDGFFDFIRGQAATGNTRIAQEFGNSGWNVKIQVSVLYRNHEKCCKSGRTRFLKTVDLTFTGSVSPFKGVEYIIIDKKYYPPIVNDIIDFRICCNTERIFAFVIVKDCDNRLVLIKYSIHSGRFVAMARLPCDAKIKSWTTFDSDCDNGIITCKDCCALFVFELPPPCDDCERCPPKSGVVAYCCRREPLRLVDGVDERRLDG